MSYLPKSKYQLLQSSGDKYLDPRTNSPYVGPYILTSEGAYKGNNVLYRKEKLILIPPPSVNKNTNIYFYENTKIYNKANKDKYLSLIGGFKPIIATKSKPTEKEYQIGYYIRYFCKRNNTNNNYLEIDEKTHKALLSKKTYDYFLYTPGSLRWAVDGDIIKSNSNTLSLTERFFPNISTFFVKLNEFQKVRKTKGGELQYLNGKEYVGYYHIHENKPMVGLFHTSESHETLRYISSTKTSPTPRSNRTSRSLGEESTSNNRMSSGGGMSSGGSSGGGGGGY
tara:strand:- start:18 stop:863 length:846 start_codon:yes stop_codon:yes gene_type:complete